MPKVDGFSSLHVAMFRLITFVSLQNGLAGRDGMSLEFEAVHQSANSDGVSKDSISSKDHLVDIKQVDMIEKLGREIAKNLANQLEDREKSQNADQATKESGKHALEAAQQHAHHEEKEEAHNQKKSHEQKDVSEARNSSEDVVVAADVAKSDGNDGLLELAEELVHKLQHHGKDRKKQSEHSIERSLATSATGVFEHSAAAFQDVRHNESSPSQVAPEVLPPIKHKPPTIEKRMRDVEANLMQLQAKVALRKDKIGFEHALDMFEFEARGRPCIDFDVIDKKMHSIPVGSISREEFVQVCKKDGVFEKIDLDASGKIDAAEYEHACKEKVIDGSSLSLASLNKRNSTLRSARSIAYLSIFVVLGAIV